MPANKASGDKPSGRAKPQSRAKTVALNRKARYNYEILRTLEAGLVLTGTEIKSIRAGNVNFADAYALPKDGELWLQNAHIAAYAAADRGNHEPTRPRKLLLHRSQIRDLSREVSAKGLTLVPLRMYLSHGLAKVELGLARGKRLHDKRQTLIERERKREAEQAIKRRY